LTRLACAAVIAVTAAAPAIAGQEPPQPISDLVATLLPKVVNITVERREPAPAAAVAKPAAPAAYIEKRYYGSGFIVDPSGIIVTNNHVVEGAHEVTVFLHDGTRLHATVLYRARIDMAILRVHSDKPLPAIKWGDSNVMRPGDPVIAIGNPLGIGVTVTAGIVSALDRDIHETPYASFIQTDAAINPGNSGGPLFNTAGEVIGIDTALYSPGSAESGSIGLGFAIPGNDAQFTLNEWHEYGRVRPGWIGAHGQTVTPDIADAAGLPPPPRGVIVDTVDAGSPAAKAGIQQGDVILKVGDEDIAAMRTFNRTIAGTPLGDTVPVMLWRNGASVTVRASIVEDPSAPPPPPPAPAAAAAATLQPLDTNDVGIRLSPITPALREQYDIGPAQNGVVITNVMAGSIAAERGIQPGDVIVKFGDQPVTSTGNLMALVDKAQQARQQHALMLFQDKRGPRWVGMPLFHEAQ
jgi:serine protease Do